MSYSYVNENWGQVSVISTNELLGMAAVLLAIAGLAEAAGEPIPDPSKLPPVPVPAFAQTTILQVTSAAMDIDLVGAYFY